MNHFGAIRASYDSHMNGLRCRNPNNKAHACARRSTHMFPHHLAGYNIIRAIGVRVSVITPSRGFCIELSTAAVVVVASKLGLPISTTHCQVCVYVGVGGRLHFEHA